MWGVLLKMDNNKLYKLMLFEEGEAYVDVQGHKSTMLMKMIGI